ncbi:MAG: pentapeptide repeat-containing protein [Oscillospiraceae bacterium]|jgi:uncharacterized protein YjbI with pentapeptide repeats|nr:pentapeptide repeat-containing protein [Oscillospiraceae bacterium]
MNATTIQAFATLITAVTAVAGIVLSFMTAKIAEQQSQENRASARADRFTRAIEHLKDESLAIRMGALFELEKIGTLDNGAPLTLKKIGALCLKALFEQFGLENIDLQSKAEQEAKTEQEAIVRILSPFIRNGIEDEELLVPSKRGFSSLTSQEDIFLACEIASKFYEQTQARLNLLRLHVNINELDLILFRLCGADLRSANLSKTFLLEADLRWANLQYADLEGANLRATDLQEADLLDANLFKACLIRANLQRANLAGANLGGAYLAVTNLARANLARAGLREANLELTNLEEANLQGAYLKKANLQKANLQKATLEGADLTHAVGLTPEQLLTAVLDDKTKLDPDLRSAYDKLKAGRGPSAPQ